MTDQDVITFLNGVMYLFSSNDDITANHIKHEIANWLMSIDVSDFAVNVTGSGAALAGYGHYVYDYSVVVFIISPRTVKLHHVL